MRSKNVSATSGNRAGDNLVLPAVEGVIEGRDMLQGNMGVDFVSEPDVHRDMMACRRYRTSTRWDTHFNHTDQGQPSYFSAEIVINRSNLPLKFGLACGSAPSLQPLKLMNIQTSDVCCWLNAGCADLAEAGTEDGDAILKFENWVNIVRLLSAKFKGWRRGAESSNGEADGERGEEEEEEGVDVIVVEPSRVEDGVWSCAHPLSLSSHSLLPLSLSSS
eukprot:736029-Rhodomonas_salina.1